MHVSSQAFRGYYGCRAAPNRHKGTRLKTLSEVDAPSLVLYTVPMERTREFAHSLERWQPHEKNVLYMWTTMRGYGHGKCPCYRLFDRLSVLLR